MIVHSHRPVDSDVLSDGLLCIDCLNGWVDFRSFIWDSDCVSDVAAGDYTAGQCTAGQ